MRSDFAAAAPANGEAQALARSASVIKTMNKGNWEKEGGDFHDKLKDAAETADLENASSLVSDEATLTRIVDRLKEQIKTDPENINLYRDICANLRTLHRYSEALEYVRQARQQPLGKGDTTLEKWEHDFIVAEMEAKISDPQKELEANPNDAQKKAELDELSKKEHDYKLENAKLMVERYPNDFNYRYIYGQLLFEDGKARRRNYAIPSFRQQQPQGSLAVAARAWPRVHTRQEVRLGC